MATKTCAVPLCYPLGETNREGCVSRKRLTRTKFRNVARITCAAERNDSSGGSADSRPARDKDAFSPPEVLISEKNLQEALDRALGGEESQAMLRDLAAAADKVARAKEMLADVERQQRMLQELEEEVTRATEMEERLRAADSEVELRAQEVASAAEEARMAAAALVEARAGLAPASLPADFLRVDANAERVESAKTAAVAALTGTAVSLPFVAAERLAMPTLLEDFVSVPGLAAVSSCLTIAATCAVFGVVFRYVVRSDVANNGHLKSGVVLGFTVARGLAQIDTALIGPSASLSSLSSSAVGATESLLVFALVASALEFCFNNGYLRRFPLSR